MNTNLKILIVDDDVLISEYLKEILLELNYQHIAMTHTAEVAEIEIKKFKPDVVLLDIRLDQHTEGIDLATLINANHNIPFIFISAHADVEIILKATQTKPLGYITKPFKNMDVFAALQLVSANQAKFVELKDGFTTIKVNISDILFAKSDKNYIEIHTPTQRVIIRNTLEWFLQELNASNFIRVQRSFVVNKFAITKYNSKAVFINDFEIPIARNFKLE